MSVLIAIGRVDIVVLIDIGSTNNFLDLEILQKIVLQLDGTVRVQVKVANGEIFGSDGKVTLILITIQGTQFFTKPYVLGLAGCDMVLEVSWFQTLGTILWNFQELSMQFMWNK